MKKRTGRTTDWLTLIPAFLIFFSVSNAFANPLFPTTKEEVLKKYQNVIIESNQFSLSGYNLQDIAPKLRRATELILNDQLDDASDLIDEIKKDLRVVETKGPERVRRERKLAWLEVYGDLMQQIAFFIVMALIILRFNFFRRSMLAKTPSWGDGWKLALTFVLISSISGAIGVIRYGQSSWTVVDSQTLWVGIGGLVGGLWIGLSIGLINSALRLLVLPHASVYFFVPVTVGLASGFLHLLYRSRPIVRWRAFFAGLAAGLIHTLFMYVPMYSYMIWYSFYGAILLLSLVEGGVIYLFFAMAEQIFKEEKRKETERELFLTQLRFLRAQINPHFLFNTLNTIAAVCGEENAERARSLIIQLATFFRRITKHEGDFVSVQDELEYIDAYLGIEKARFGERLCVKKNIQLSDMGLKTRIPVLVLQPIVENAVKHGLSKKSEGGVITISASETESSMVVRIQDTGMGMNEEIRCRLFEKAGPDMPSDDEHAGIGLSNIRERMDKLFGDQFTISVTSKLNEGTVVQITFPKT